MDDRRKVTQVKIIHGRTDIYFRFLDAFDVQHDMYGNCYKNPTRSSQERIRRVIKSKNVAVDLDTNYGVITLDILEG